MHYINPMTDLPSLSFQPAKQDDNAFLFAAYAASRDDEMAMVMWDETAKNAFLQTQFAAQQRHYLAHYDNVSCHIVKLREQSVGLIWVARWPKEIRLMDMVVLTQYRNQGIGTYLLQQLMAEAAQTNRMVTLHTWEGNPAAARFYIKHGFAKVSSDGMYAQMEWRAQPSDTVLTQSITLPTQPNANTTTTHTLHATHTAHR